jgi:hypothetical protein
MTSSHATDEARELAEEGGSDVPATWAVPR